MSGDPLRYFRIEAKEISAELASSAPELARAGASAAVMRMLRLAHTIKGAAGIVKQQAIAAHAHALEDVLMPHREGDLALPSDAIAAALAEVDAIAALTAALSSPAMPAAAEEDVGVIHAELADLDGLLHGLGEAGTHLGNLRAVAALAQQARNLCGGLSLQGDAVEAGQTLRELLAAIARRLDGGLDLAERELRQVRGRAEGLRLLPCGALLTALERAARNAAAAAGKQIGFTASGGEIRLDARVLVPLQRALVQLVRNAIAHGIEMPATRLAAGKPAAGQITVEIVREGAAIRFACRDDGAGLDLAALRAAARGRGILNSEALGADALFRALLDGGFSTAAAVTEISGRGVGLGIVRDAITRLGGRLSAASEQGRGTRIEIIVPASLAAAPALLVQSGGSAHAIALGAVRRAFRLDQEALLRTPEGACIADGGVPVVKLAHLLRGERKGDAPDGAVLMLQGRSGRLALGVDRILGSEDVVVRPLPPDIADPMASGLTLDAEGVPRLFLEADGLIAAVARLAGHGAPEEKAPPPPILVIDDSLTTRALEQSILESAGYEVEQAISAEEGLQKARARRYGLILVDAEMPGMDGFAFLAALRADPVLHAIPAIMVTSRDAPEDQVRGLAAGADDYVVKGAFNQNRFLASIRKLLEAA